ncbi:glycosyltransferase family 2 protein [Actinoalloteichus sp. GBA129-24]|uniref:glycosyltransferase family 2 protein n=1 Tax=Actinoalloteichus sp. GBA129-24 TaxID=1612551 RepID=UPI0009507FCC|nr:glycosyltransferase family 2 protein [Actinoalloteichus sp. GBA129-24]APU21296.1 glycosyl transferase [Actinoalloteichus sp. GBA129-24]
MKRMIPLVSVIVPTLNRPVELGQALASVAAQQGVDLAEVEVVVINDGGTSVESVIATARDWGLPVVAMNHPRRCGLPSARNTGLDLSRGRYVAFLDDDDVFLPRHLVTALAGLESGADGVATTCLVTDHRIDPDRPVREAVVWDVGFDPLLLEVCNLFPVHTAVFRRPATARLHPGLPAIEDWDFWLRLTREHGYRFSRIHQPTVVYHRVPQADSMIGAVAEEAPAMAEFSALVRRIWFQWPPTTARSARFRLYSGIMYWKVLGALATGAPPNPHYYLHSIQAIEHAWHEPQAEADLVDQLARTVRGEHAGDRHAA